MPHAQDIGAFDALRRAVRLCVGAPRVAAAAMAVELAGQLVALGASAAVLALAAPAAERVLLSAPRLWLTGGGSLFLAHALRELAGTRALAPALGACLAAGALVEVLRLVWSAWAARHFGCAVAGRSTPEALVASTDRLHRAAAVTVLGGVLWVTSRLFATAATGAAGLAWVLAVSSERPATGRSAALALAGALSLSVSVGVSVVGRLALVRAVGADRGALQAIGEAAVLALRRVGTFTALEVTFGAAGLVAATAFESMGGLVVSVAGGGLAAAVLAQTATGAAASLVRGALGAAELGAYATLDAGARGELPEPPPDPAPDPVLATEAIVQTELVVSTRPLA